MNNGTVNVRTRDNKVSGEFSLDEEVLAKFGVLRTKRILKTRGVRLGNQEEQAAGDKSKSGTPGIRINNAARRFLSKPRHVSQ